MKEYGGYFELDTYRLPMLHEDAVALNCGRNCLAYLIKSRRITKIKMPYFMCDCVFDICIKNGVEISYYHIDNHFIPIDVTLLDDEWLYVMNFYGQLSQKVIYSFLQNYKRIIVDNSQAYFEMPIDTVDTIYTCRKFFGVADGAFLYTNSKVENSFPIDQSFERMRFVLGRFERTASEFYMESSRNNELFENEPIKYMSKLTHNLLHGIDYVYVRKRRTDNYLLYHSRLDAINQLDVYSIQGAFAYPLLVDNGVDIRKKLQKKKIYIPTLWPNVVVSMPKDSLEYRFANNILPLPCDQRYSKDDIEYILEVLLESV